MRKRHGIHHQHVEEGWVSVVPLGRETSSRMGAACFLSVFPVSQQLQVRRISKGRAKKNYEVWHAYGARCITIGVVFGLICRLLGPLRSPPDSREIVPPGFEWRDRVTVRNLQTNPPLIKTDDLSTQNTSNTPKPIPKLPKT